MRKALKDMYFPEWFVQFASRSGRTSFMLFEILNASSKDGAEVGFVISGSWYSTLRPANKSEKHMSYSKFRKLEDPNRISIEAKRGIVKGVFGNNRI